MDISQRVLFTASADQTIKKWDIVSGEYRQTLKGHNASVTKIAVKDKLLVSTSADWSVRMWSAQFGDFIKKFEGGHEHMVSCLKWLDGLGKQCLLSTICDNLTLCPSVINLGWIQFNSYLHFSGHWWW